MSLDPVIDSIEQRLRGLGTPERAAGEKRYLKSDLTFLGVTVPGVRKEARRWLKEHPELDRRALLALARALWDRPVHELRSFAAALLRHRLDQLRAGDLRLVERMLDTANTWAHVDEIAVRVAGPLIERYPERAARLDAWATDESFWLRRSALLALLLGLRRGEGDWDRFVRYADALLDEKEFFIRKAIGWVLREASGHRPEEVRRFVERRMARISGVTFREAVRRLDANDREELTRAYRAR